MTAEQILIALLDRGIRIGVVDREVRLRAPRGALTPELRRELRDASMAALLVAVGFRDMSQLTGERYAQRRSGEFLTGYLQRGRPSPCRPADGDLKGGRAAADGRLSLSSLGGSAR